MNKGLIYKLRRPKEKVEKLETGRFGRLQQQTTVDTHYNTENDLSNRK